MLESFKTWMRKKNASTVVAFHGKARIPHIGHKIVTDKAKEIANQVGGTPYVNLSGASAPLSVREKQEHAKKLFGMNNVHAGNKDHSSLVGFLTHLHNSGFKNLHLVAGSDRVSNYRSILKKYNGRPDKKGNVPFHFDSWRVHQVGSERNENNPKHPTKMSDDELVQSASATRLEKHAKEGDYPAFKAYHKHMKDSDVKDLYNKIRNTN